jgi:hypothetical protein
LSLHHGSRCRSMGLRCRHVGGLDCRIVAARSHIVVTGGRVVVAGGCVVAATGVMLSPLRVATVTAPVAVVAVASLWSSQLLFRCRSRLLSHRRRCRCQHGVEATAADAATVWAGVDGVAFRQWCGGWRARVAWSTVEATSSSPVEAEHRVVASRARVATAWAASRGLRGAMVASQRRGLSAGGEDGGSLPVWPLLWCTVKNDMKAKEPKRLTRYGVGTTN